MLNGKAFAEYDRVMSTLQCGKISDRKYLEISKHLVTPEILQMVQNENYETIDSIERQGGKVILIVDERYSRPQRNNKNRTSAIFCTANQRSREAQCIRKIIRKIKFTELMMQFNPSAHLIKRRTF